MNLGTARAISLLLAVTKTLSDQSCPSVIIASAQNGCTACVQAGCAWSLTGFSTERCTTVEKCMASEEDDMQAPAPQTCITDTSGCCVEDERHARAAKWLCSDQCSTCSCASGTVNASGCVSGGGMGQPAEAYLVQVAFGAVVFCLATFGAFCWIMLCCRRRAMQSKELTSPQEEEEDQLAAGD